MCNRNSFEIVLIRHGKTQANLDKLYCGFTDLSLSQEGKEEIVKLKSKINYPKAQKYICSGLKRTVETLNILYDNPNFEVEPKFKEMNFGDFEMKSYEDLKENQDYVDWITDKVDRALNGESKTEFRQRVVNAFESLQENCLVLCHGGVIVYIMEHLFPNIRNYYQWQPSYGKGYTIKIENGKAVSFEEIG